MNEEHNIKVKIQAEIEELLGADKIEQQLGEVTQRVANIAPKINEQSFGEFNKEEYLDTFSKKDKAQMGVLVDNIQNRFNKVDEGSAEFLTEYLAEKNDGLTVSQVKSWKRKFRNKGSDFADEIEKLHNSVNARTANFDDDKREEVRRTMHETIGLAKGDLKNAWEDAADGVAEYHKQIKLANTETESFFESVKKAGWFALSGMVANEGINIAKGIAEINAKEMTAFDFTSPVGMYQKEKEFELFEKTRERSMWGKGIGIAIGGGIGAFAGPLAAVAGAGFGAAAGAGIADIFNTEESGEFNRDLMFKIQAHQTASKNVEELRAYEIPAQRYEMRFGEDLRGSSGFGYTAHEELKLKSGFGGSLGMFDSELYNEQTAFARAYGLDPTDVYKVNQVTKMTGYEFGVEDLSKVSDSVKEIYGENADNKRIIEILEAIKNINTKVLQSNVDGNTKDAMMIAELPKLLFGIDSPYGRLGDMGLNTIQTLGGLTTPKDEAHNAFLYQAFGKEGIVDFTERKKAGIGYKDNLERVLSTVDDYADGSEFRAWSMLNQFMPNAPAYFNPKIAQLVSGDRELETVQGYYNKDDEGNYINKKGNIVQGREEARISHIEYKALDKDQQLNVEKETIVLHGIKDLISRINEVTDKTGKNQDEAMAEVLNLADKGKTKFESAAEEISNIHLEIGNSYKDMMLNQQKVWAVNERIWLSSGETYKQVMDLNIEALDAFRKKLMEFGILEEESEIEVGEISSIRNRIENELKDYQEGLPKKFQNLSEDEIKRLSDPKDRKLDEYIEYGSNVLSENAKAYGSNGLLYMFDELEGAEEKKHWSKLLSNGIDKPSIKDMLQQRAIAELDIEQKRLPEDRRWLEMGSIEKMTAPKEMDIATYVEHLSKVIAENKHTFGDGPFLFSKEIEGDEEVKYYREKLQELMKTSVIEKGDDGVIMNDRFDKAKLGVMAAPNFDSTSDFNFEKPLELNLDSDSIGGKIADSVSAALTGLDFSDIKIAIKITPSSSTIFGEPAVTESDIENSEITIEGTS